MVLVLWCPFDEIGGPWRHTRMDLPIINPTYRLLVSAFVIVGASASLESLGLTRSPFNGTGESVGRGSVSRAHRVEDLAQSPGEAGSEEMKGTYTDASTRLESSLRGHDFR